MKLDDYVCTHEARTALLTVQVVYHTDRQLMAINSAHNDVTAGACYDVICIDKVTVYEIRWIIYTHIMAHTNLQCIATWGCPSRQSFLSVIRASEYQISTQSPFPFFVEGARISSPYFSQKGSPNYSIFEDDIARPMIVASNDVLDFRYVASSA